MEGRASILLSKFRKPLDSFVSIILDVAALLMLFALVLMFVQVVMRFVFNNPIYGLDEAVVFFIVWSNALGFVTLTWQNDNPVIDALIHKMPSIIKKVAYSIFNVLMSISGFSIVVGGVELFPLQASTAPKGGLPFSRAYYFALPMIVMGVLFGVLWAYRTVEYVILRNDALVEGSDGGGQV